VKTAGRLAEDRVERWLRARDLRPERFPPRRRRLSKTPDFRVAAPAGAAFFVEVKTLTRERPSYGAVVLKLLRARAQFDAVNHGGHLANVLALVAQVPARLATVIDDVAPLPTGPLHGVDLVLGFDATDDGVCVLHDAASCRHAPVLARLTPAAPSLLGDDL
jgi:hypothetical protein